MNVRILIKSALFTIIAIGLGLAPMARAAHATNFLDTLQADVENRLANADTNVSAAEKRALQSAARTLARNSANLGADLGLLASAATALDARFADDAVFAFEENAAVLAYSSEAQAQLNAIGALLGTNSAPPALSNQLTQAQAALDRANEGSNSVPVRARAAKLALNKIRAANILALRLFKAPLSLDGKIITVTGRESDNERITIDLASNHTYAIPAHGDEDEELGTWSYARTGANTGTITLTPTVPPGGSHILNLKFTNSTRGTIAAGSQTAGGEAIRGSFSISDE